MEPGENSGNANGEPILDSGNEHQDPTHEDNIPQEDLHLPLESVTRIMRSVLPPHARISNEAKEVIQESVSKFIHEVTAHASLNCHDNRRRRIGGDDIISSLNYLGFDNYTQILRIYLARYREARRIPNVADIEPVEMPPNNFGHVPTSQPNGLLPPQAPILIPPLIPPQVGPSVVAPNILDFGDQAPEDGPTLSSSSSCSCGSVGAGPSDSK